MEAVIVSPLAGQVLDGIWQGLDPDPLENDRHCFPTQEQFLTSPDGESMLYDTREADRTYELKQRAFAVTPSDDAVAHVEALGWEVVSVRLIKAIHQVMIEPRVHPLGQYYAATILRRTKPWCGTVIEREVELNGIQQKLMSGIDGEIRPRWCNRTVVLGDDDGDFETAQWLRHDPVKGSWLPNLEDKDEAARLRRHANASWGNYALVIPGGRMRQTEEEVVIAGIVDSLILWGRLQEMRDQSKGATRALVSPETLTRTQLRKSQGELFRLNGERALLDLGIDEARVQVLGLRRQIGSLWMHAWEMDSHVQRVTERIGLANELLKSQLAASQERYQRLVDRLLQLISVLTLAQFVLVVADASSPETPGKGHADMGIIRFIRSVSMDVWFLSSLALAGFCLVLIWWAKREARKTVDRSARTAARSEDQR